MNKLLLIISTLLSISLSYSQKSNSDYYSLAKNEIKLNNNYLAASKLCEKGLTTDPNNTDMSVLLGKCYLELGRYTEARYLLKSILDQDTHNSDARFHLLNLEHQTKRYSSAIAYADELLEEFPYNKDLLIKKVGIYNDMGNIVELQGALKRLYQIFPDDLKVVELYRNITLEQSRKAKKKGDLTLGITLNTDLIEKNIANEAVYLSVIDNEISQGNYDSALHFAERGLFKFKNNIDLSLKKIKLLELQKKYDDAIQFATVVNKQKNLPSLNKKIRDIMEESANFYEKKDPYVIHKKLYGITKKKESLDYLLKTAFSKGYYIDAQYFLDEALKKYPASKNYLYKQYELYVLTNNTTEKRKSLQKLVELFPLDYDIMNLYNIDNYTLGKEYLAQSDFKNAELIFKNLLKFDSYFVIASENLVTIYTKKNDINKAILVLNKLLDKDPKNNNYLLKKSLLLSKNNNFGVALGIIKNLKDNNPVEKNKYSDAYITQLETYLKIIIEDENYIKSISIIDELLELDPKNEIAYNSAIKVYTITRDFPSAIAIIEKAIINISKPKGYLLKLADLYYKNEELNNADRILSNLAIDYPYNQKIEQSLLELLIKKGNRQIANEQVNLAHKTFDRVIHINPKDSIAFQKKIALYLSVKKLDSAMLTVNKALKIAPNKTKFLLDKGVIYERQKKYDSAYVFQSKYKPSLFEKEEFNDHLDLLKSKTYKNFVALNYIRTFANTLSLDRSFVTFEYTRFGLKNNFSTRLYYSTRNAGIKGYQEEFQWVRKLNKKYYIQSTIAFGQRTFPKYSTNLTLFRNLKNDYEIEFGLGYFKLQDNENVYQINSGISKTWEDYWINLRGRTLINKNYVYTNAVLNSRLFINPKKDYFSVAFAYGNSPVNQEISNPNDSLNQFVSSSLSFGFKKNIQYKTFLELNGSWLNYNTRQNTFINQYNISLTLSTKF